MLDLRPCAIVIPAVYTPLGATARHNCGCHDHKTHLWAKLTSLWWPRPVPVGDHWPASRLSMVGNWIVNSAILEGLLQDA